MMKIMLENQKKRKYHI